MAYLDDIIEKIEESSFIYKYSEHESHILDIVDSLAFNAEVIDSTCFMRFPFTIKSSDFTKILTVSEIEEFLDNGQVSGRDGYVMNKGLNIAFNYKQNSVRFYLDDFIPQISVSNAYEISFSRIKESSTVSKEDILIDLKLNQIPEGSRTFLVWDKLRKIIEHSLVANINDDVFNRRVFVPAYGVYTDAKRNVIDDERLITGQSDFALPSNFDTVVLEKRVVDSIEGPSFENIFFRKDLTAEFATSISELFVTQSKFNESLGVTQYFLDEKKTVEAKQVSDQDSKAQMLNYLYTVAEYVNTRTDLALPKIEHFYKYDRSNMWKTFTYTSIEDTTATTIPCLTINSSGIFSVGTAPVKGKTTRYYFNTKDTNMDFQNLPEADLKTSCSFYSEVASLYTDENDKLYRNNEQFIISNSPYFAKEQSAFFDHNKYSVRLCKTKDYGVVLQAEVWENGSVYVITNIPEENLLDQRALA